MHEDNSNRPNSGVGSNPNPEGEKNPVSAKKLEANRENAKKSTGPTSDAGKARSSQNAYTHGFYAKRTFPTADQWAKDGNDYQAAARGLIEHYRPVGWLENMLVERIATGFLRSARIIGHEQQVFSWRAPFEVRSASSLPRYQAAIERQLAKDIERLEQLQAQRKGDTSSALAAKGSETVTAAETSESDSPEEAAGVDPGSLANLASAAETLPEKPETGQKSAETNPPAAARPAPAVPSDLAAVGAGDRSAETNPAKTLADIIDETIN